MKKPSATRRTTAGTRVKCDHHLQAATDHVFERVLPPPVVSSPGGHLSRSLFTGRLPDRTEMVPGRGDYPGYSNAALSGNPEVKSIAAYGVHQHEIRNINQR